MDPALDVDGDARQTAGQAGEKIQQAADSREVSWLGRAGLAARGVVYLLLGTLALLLVFGSRSQHVDQRGALAEVASHPGGSLVLLLLALGFAGYALWRFAEAIRALRGEGDRDWPKVIGSVLGGIAYGALTFSAVSVLSGSRQSQSAQQQGFTARVMSYPGGQVVVALVGLAIIGASGYLVYEGASGKMMKDFRPIPAGRRAVIRVLGLIGGVGRGVVFGLVGVLVFYAAWSYSPDKAGGIDVALKTVLGEPYGRWLVLAAALALLAFGLFGLAEARYRRT